MKRFIACLCAVLISGVLLAEEVLNNASVIELQGLNLGDSVIIEKIKTSKCDFDTSVTGLKELKAAKVSDAVIQAMVATKAPAAKAKPAGAVSNESNDPAVLHGAGVWILKDKKMTKLGSETPTGQTSDYGYRGPWGMGGDRKTEVILSGSKSDVHLTEPKPVFYFYLGHMQQNAMSGEATMEFANIQSPKEIVLTRFTRKTTKNHDERALVTGSHNAYAGSTFGIDEKAMRPFDSEEIAEGIYKVTPKDDLPDGEYGFTAASSQGHGRFFTFGVESP
jgi:hypothetical protein